MKLGQRIASMRGYRLMTQDDLGALVGVTKQTISGWERGRRFPSADDLVKLCGVLNCSADYLLGLSDEMGERR
jgi:transcriptional regulator with XRE-family HTH domain